MAELAKMRDTFIDPLLRPHALSPTTSPTMLGHDEVLLEHLPPQPQVQPYQPTEADYQALLRSVTPEPSLLTPEAMNILPRFSYTPVADLEAHHVPLHVISFVQQNREHLLRVGQDQHGFRAGLTSPINTPLDDGTQVSFAPFFFSLAIADQQLVPGRQPESSTDDPKCANTSGAQPSSAQKHVPMSQFTSLRVPQPPDKLHPTLSCWIKNMNKLSSLIDRLQNLASSAPAEQQSQLLKHVVALRAMCKKQREHFMEFLQLSEEYANKYLLNIDATIQQHSDFLAKLEGRLEAATKLRGEAADLQMFYESETAATMKDLRATGKAGFFRLQRQILRRHSQYFGGRFQRTIACSTRWTSY